MRALIFGLLIMGGIFLLALAMVDPDTFRLWVDPIEHFMFAN
jgi:hypothetical protein